MKQSVAKRTNPSPAPAAPAQTPRPAARRPVRRPTRQAALAAQEKIKAHEQRRRLARQNGMEGDEYGAFDTDEDDSSFEPSSESDTEDDLEEEVEEENAGGRPVTRSRG